MDRKQTKKAQPLKMWPRRIVEKEKLTTKESGAMENNE